MEPFEITPQKLCYENTISWILMEENPILMDLSKKINDLMLTKYNIHKQRCMEFVIQIIFV